MANYDTTSRYYSCDDEDGIPQSNLTKNNYSYDTTTILANEDGRLDLVSYRIYNTPTNWWILARFNGIINPETARAGTLIKIPRLG